MNVIKRPLIYIPVLIVLIAAGIGAYYMFFANQDPIPQNIRSQVDFTLYYPKTLPSGWSIDKSSFYADARDQVVGYKLVAPNGILSLTVQPIPKNFDFNDFYTKRMSGTVQFLTTLGQGAIGRAEGQTVGSLVTTSSWVLALSSSGNVSQGNIQSVLSNLHQATN